MNNLLRHLRVAPFEVIILVVALFLVGSQPAYAINSASINATGASGANCNTATINYSFSVTTDTDDISDPDPAADEDRFLVRLLDADNNIIASNGLSFISSFGTFGPSTIPITVGDTNRSADTVVAPTKRPFRFQILESTTDGAGLSTPLVGGAVEATSATFDPYDGGGTFDATGCGSLPGGVIFDTTPPTLATTPGNLIANTDPGVATATVTYTNPTFNDNIGVTSVTQTAGLASGSAFPVGVTTNTFQAADAAGNTFDHSFTVTVSDNEAPTLNTTPGNLTANTAPGLATATVTYTNPTFNDNIAVTSVSQTAGLASGSAFPVGVTTNTFRATDAAGNTFDHSFTVTVSDNEAPTFVTVPSNINVAINFGQTGAVVTYATPTATDNQPGVAVALFAGLASGATFPIGATVVTHEATDASGNKTQASFTVTVSVIPPGQVEIKVNSASDGQFSFTSVQPEFTFNLVSAGGSGTSGVIQIKPGTYAFSFTKPDGFGITDASCTNSGSTINTTALTGSITLASGQNITCTITVVDALGETLRQIGDFLQTRATLITQNAPNSGRRIERLTGRYTNTGGVSGSGLNFNNENIPFALNILPNGGEFAFSLLKSQMRTGHGIEKTASLADRGNNFYDAGNSTGAISRKTTTLLDASSDPDNRVNTSLDPMKHRYDLWIEGKMGKYDTNSADGEFAIIHAGFDYLLTPKVLIGMGIQIDWLDQDEDITGELSGTGFLIGPSITAHLNDNFYLDARLAWGESDNDISPFDTYEDSFDSERWLVSAALIGDFSHGAWRITPEVRLNYFEDESESYIDSLNVSIPSVQSRVGELEFGPRIDYQMDLDDGSIFSPYVTIKGIQTFKNKNTFANLVGATPNTGETGFRARTELGFTLVKQERYTVSASTFYDGIDDGQFDAWGGNLELRVPFR
ncbi:MAG: HYR domain-containing protein [Gammaproteobacteria bacterium]|nr:HYR domain-containing protein [Gammaproteobacteria bacterium]